MAALFQLVPVLPTVASPIGYPSAGFNPLGDASLRCGLDPTAGLLNTNASLPAMAGFDPATALTNQLVGMLASLMVGQLLQPSAGDSNSNSSADPSAASSSSSSAGTADASQFSGGTDSGKSLAAAAEKEANAEGTTGYCYRGVGRALRTLGINTSGESAYMAADQLAQNPKVKEIHVERAELSKLPPGAIVVWAQGPGHPHGHISVALGDGREASDHIQKQIQDLGGNDSFRVFMPV